NWNGDLIQAQFETMDAAGTVNLIPINVPNLSAPQHVETHREMIRNYGADVSPSSLIHQANAFEIRMYFFDHNPPHFHVLLNTGTQAKIAIGSLDTLAGDLPSGRLSEVRAWARTHREALMQNWHRCQSGDHPFVLGAI
ncbi:MAG: DUF4160 domain-containing protein, partial [Candidatus Acidiferrales bacterium]